MRNGWGFKGIGSFRNIPSAYFARLERKISSTADTLKANGCLLCAEAIAMSSGINIEIVQRELAVMARKQLVYFRCT